MGPNIKKAFYFAFKSKDNEFIDELYKQIGKQKIKIEWLKKGGIV